MSMPAALGASLFSDQESSTYAVIDGAACDDLLDRFDEFQPEYACLYAGELAPDLAECAPYLVRLRADHRFTRWVLDEGWGKHWAIFVVGPADLKQVRKHFRTFLMVKGPDGGPLYFRFYDPRILRVFLPTCSPDQLSAMFGPLSRYVAEGQGDEITEFEFSSAQLLVRQVNAAGRG